MKIIHQDAGEESLQFLRTYIFGLWIIIISFNQIEKLSYISISLFRPIGFFIRFLPESLYPFLIDIRFLVTLKLMLIACLACFVLNIFRKTTGILACIGLTLHQGIGRSFGQINHAEISLLYAAFILVAFECANSFYSHKDTIKSDKFNPNGVPILMIMATICTAYCLIGINRLVYGGIEIFQTEGMTIWVLQNSQTSRFLGLNLEQLILANPWLSQMLNIAFPVSTLIEISAPFCLISHRFRRTFVLLMIPFHIFVWIFMGPDFWENILLYIVFIDYSNWLKPRKVENSINPIVFYDGVCGLCNRFIQWLLHQDRTAIFRFAPLQGNTAKKFISQKKTNPGQWTIIFYDNGCQYMRSDAVLKIIYDLGGIWRIFAWLRIVPVCLRNYIYNIVARFRYPVFGKLDVCPIPKEEVKNRFLN